MIIACPACSTRYIVPDEAIGIDGRTVRCAKCKHSWFQDGSEVKTAPSARPEPEARSTDSVNSPSVNETAREEGRSAEPPQPSVSHWRTSDREENAESKSGVQKPDIAGAAFEDQEVSGIEDTATKPEVKSEYTSAPAKDVYFDEEHSQFDYKPPFRGRRNPLKLWTAAALTFAIAALGIIVAVNIWGLPEWVPINRPTFAMSQPELQLEFPPDQQELRTLPNGTEYFGANGSVTNVGRETVDVPPILIVLRDELDRIVYSYEITPIQRSLAPGETMVIKEAITDVPRSAKFVEVGWKQN